MFRTTALAATPTAAARPAARTAGWRLAAAAALATLVVAVGPAAAQTEEQVKTEFARAVYQASAGLVHDERPQPLLRAVVVLRIKLDAQNRYTAEVFRDNPQQPAMTQVALDSVAKLPPAERLGPRAQEMLRGEGLIEAWLFQTDGRFALKTLAKPQRGA